MGAIEPSRRSPLPWLLASVLAVGPAFPEGAVHLTTAYLRDSKSLAYPDAAGTAVTSPFLTLDAALDDRTALHLRTNADAISAASRRIDAVAQASRRAGGSATRAARRAWVPDHGALEVRLQNEGDLRREAGPVEIHAGGGVSYEWDYESRYLQGGVEVPLAMKNTTWSLDGSWNADTYTPDIVGQDYDRPKRWTTLTTGVTQLLSSTALAEVSLYHSEASDYLSNPYNFFPTPTGFRQENLPEFRQRNALLFRGAQWLPTRTALHGLLRTYVDSWGVRSQSGEVQAYQDVVPGVTLRLRYRAYRQSASDFYDPAGIGAAPYATVDERYSGFTAHLAGVKILWDLPEGWVRSLGSALGAVEVSLKGDTYLQTTGYTASVVAGGLGVRF